MISLSRRTVYLVTRSACDEIRGIYSGYTWFQSKTLHFAKIAPSRAAPTLTEHGACLQGTSSAPLRRGPGSRYVYCVASCDLGVTARSVQYMLTAQAPTWRRLHGGYIAHVEPPSSLSRSVQRTCLLSALAERPRLLPPSHALPTHPAKGNAHTSWT